MVVPPSLNLRLLSPDDAPADEVPADDAQAPIDLVSETSESDGSASDSDHSSDVAIVEPVDQAAAVFLTQAP